VAFPAALIGRPADEDALPWTDLDWEEAAALAVRTLAAAGHRTMVYLAPGEAEVRARRSYALRGIAGARRGAADTGCAVDVVHSVDDPAETGRRLRVLLAEGGHVRPTALVVQHPSAHHHILASMQSATGLRVPDDVTMVVIGTLPGDPSSSRLPRIELPVRTLASEVTRLATAAAEALREPAGGLAEPATRLLADAVGHLLIAPELIPGPVSFAAPRG
jgi:DNA-binding LacI/PurR family transcriptional regulator